jgi:hypothetical protein
MTTINKLAYSVHPIDIDTKEVKRDVVGDNADLDSFVNDLLASVAEKEEKRRFAWTASTSEVRAQLGKVIENAENFDEASETIAKRLLIKEKAAQKEHGQITDLQRGTLFQLLFRNGNGLSVLLAKVFNSKFLDEKYRKHDHGLPFERKVLKACLVEFDGDGDVKTVSVSDSNSTIARFWWSNFLELEEQTTDEFNTNTAFASIEALLARRLKKDFKPDYYQFRNHLITFFNTRARYSHKDMLANVFGAYRPINPALEVAKIQQEVGKLPEKKGFDETFDIVPEIVKKRRRTKLALTDQIDIEIKDTIDADAIRAASLKDGTRGVFIRSDVGFESFPTQTPIVIPNPVGARSIQSLASKSVQHLRASN